MAPLRLFAHPFSSYCQKVIVALYENAIEFEFRMLDADHADNGAEWARRWPLRKMPILIDGERAVVESSTIIEYLQVTRPGGVRLLPDEPMASIEVRMLDRVFDNYVMQPMMKLVADTMRDPDTRDPLGVAEAQAMLDTAYAWLDERLANRAWAAGADFSLADCAAAPSLFYADWVRPIPAAYATLRDYRARVLARPSMARAVDEARPYRPLFPPGAPDRD